MTDEEKTKDQLIAELADLRARLAAFEDSDSQPAKSMETLQESEEKYRQLFDLVSDALFLIDSTTGRILEVNTAAEAIYGYRREELLQKKNTDLSAQPEETSRATFEKSSLVPLRFHKKRDGTVFPVEITASHFLYGGLQVHIASIRDITERQKAEVRLRESEERLRQIIENTDAGYFYIDRDGCFRAVNAAWLRLHKYDTTDEIIGRHFSTTQVEANREKAQENVDRLLAGESIGTGDFMRRCKDGSVGHHTFSAKPVVRDGKVVGLEGFIIDTSAQKRMEETLRVVAESGAISGEEFFRFLVQKTAVSQGMRHALLARIDPHDLNTAHTVAVWSEDRYVDNFSYTLEGTPCQKVVNESPCFIPSNVQNLFPRSHRITQMGAESYWGTPIRDSAGRILGLLAVLDDRPMQESPPTLSLLNSFAARAAAEMERMKTEEKYELLFQKMLDGFALHEIICDELGRPTDYRFLAVNPAFERLTGLRAENLVGSTVRQVLPNVEQHWIDIYGRVALTGEPAYFDSYVEALGKYFEVTAFRTAPGQFACIFSDTSERKQAEEALRITQFSVEHAADPIYWVGPEGQILYANEAVCRSLGYTKEELLALSVPHIDPLCPAEKWPAFWEESKKKRSLALESVNRRKDGTTFPVEVRVNNLTFGDKAFNFVFAKDISERKQAESVRLALESQLKQAQKMEAIGTLAGGIAHDFNNILAAIIGYTEMVLVDLSEHNPMRCDLEQVLKAGYRARDLVKQILVFSRMRSGETYQPVDVGQIVREALSFLRASLPATIELREDIQSKTGTTLADPTQIHELLINLGTNAAHAMEEKGGILRVGLEDVDLDAGFLSLHPEARPGPYLKLTVADTGHGMDPQTMEHIFEPYFTTKEVGKGAGFGLAVCHGIVKRLGGIISVQSDAGKGTVFEVLLPFLDAAGSTGEESEGPIPGGKERILFVDDEKMLTDMAQRMLEQLGYNVLAVTSSVEALSVFHTRPDEFDLVMTDYTMPQMTGMDLAIEMLTIRPDIPIILCTGFSERISEKKAKDAGISEFVMKPLNRRSVAATVRKALDKRG